MTRPPSAPWTRSESPADCLTVATYNIHGAIGRDRRRSPFRIARVIRSLGADLVALQEVDATRGPAGDWLQMGEVARAGRFTAIPGPTMTHATGSYGNALLTRLAVDQVYRIDLSLPGREPRGAIDARVRTRTGTALRCICTHLGLTAGERRRQLARLLQDLAEDWDGPLVVLGDFNEWLPFSPVERTLSRLLGRSPRPRSFPAVFPLFALDRLWMHPPELLLDLRAVSNPLTRTASDHLPLVARIRCPSTRVG